MQIGVVVNPFAGLGGAVGFDCRAAYSPSSESQQFRTAGQGVSPWSNISISDQHLW